MGKQKSMGQVAFSIWSGPLFYPDMSDPMAWEKLADRVIAEHERRKRAKSKKVKHEKN